MPEVTAARKRQGWARTQACVTLPHCSAPQPSSGKTGHRTSLPPQVSRRKLATVNMQSQQERGRHTPGVAWTASEGGLVSSSYLLPPLEEYAHELIGLSPPPVVIHTSHHPSMSELELSNKPTKLRPRQRRAPATKSQLIQNPTRGVSDQGSLHPFANSLVTSLCSVGPDPGLLHPLHPHFIE